MEIMLQLADNAFQVVLSSYISKLLSVHFLSKYPKQFDIIIIDLSMFSNRHSDHGHIREHVQGTLHRRLM